MCRRVVSPRSPSAQPQGPLLDDRGVVALDVQQQLRRVRPQRREDQRVLDLARPSLDVALEDRELVGEQVDLVGGASCRASHPDPSHLVGLQEWVGGAAGGCDDFVARRRVRLATDAEDGVADVEPFGPSGLADADGAARGGVEVRRRAVRDPVGDPARDDVRALERDVPRGWDRHADGARDGERGAEDDCATRRLARRVRRQLREPALRPLSQLRVKKDVIDPGGHGQRRAPRRDRAAQEVRGVL